MTAAFPPILFLDKVFLKTQPPVLRGVELFNLNLLRDFLRLGRPVTIAADRSWRGAIEHALKPHRPDMVYVAGGGVNWFAGLLSGARLLGRRHDVLLLGNVGNGLLPLVFFLRRAGVFRSCVLIAHREATPRFVKMFGAVPGHVVAVNEKIAEPFRAAGYPGVHVDYGIFGADQFHAGPEKPVGGPVNFCVMGMLDNAWKGADTAVEAFRRLPAAVRERCVLHLASFTNPPHFPEPNIVPYEWMPPERIPDWLRAMDVMLCPSRDEEVMRETFSQAIVQGMLTELPVIASDRMVFQEKLDRGGGFIYRDVPDLAGHMARLAGDPALRRRLGAQGRQTALERYVWDTARFMRLYMDTGPTA